MTVVFTKLRNMVSFSFFYPEKYLFSSVIITNLEHKNLFVKLYYFYIIKISNN